MAKFTYTAIDQGGKQKNGSVEASSEEEANQKVSAMGLMVTSIAQGSNGNTKTNKKQARKSATQPISGSGGKGKSFHIGKAVNQEGLTVFTRQLATLLQAGLPLLRSLEVMIRQERRPAFKEILVSLADNVRSGNNLSDGLAQHRSVFDRLYVNMVRAGEKGGVLDVVLSRLARFMEKSIKTKKKVKSAMIYPAVVISVAVTIVLLLMVFVVPRFQGIFENQFQGASMPWLTEMVIGFSNFLLGSWLIWIPGLIVLIIALIFGVKTTPGRKVLDFLALKTPKLGELGRKAAIARFARTFGTLLSSGVPILDALTTTRDTIGNYYVERALSKVHDRVRDGEPLAAPLEQQKIFPTMVTSMIDVGEETGELPEMLNRIADNYDEDVDNAVSSLTSIIEPIMIVLLAVIDGIIVIALFLPIVGIIQNLTQGR